MRITFKDVGQGDSIILQWEEDGKAKIGVIDCNLKGSINPVVLHLQDLNICEIEFILLTHPHKDHYSGLIELFEYAKKKLITINKFISTLNLIGLEYFRWFEIGSEERRILAKVIKKVNELYDDGIIKDLLYADNSSTFNLSSDITITCLSPSHDEINTFARTVKYDPKGKKKEFSKAANLLSTILKLKVGETFILLTADGEKEAFERILNKHSSILAGKKFQLCQIPHHGSSHNHHEPFWSIVEKSSEPSNCAVVSAGLHDTYNHPELVVLEAFNSYGFQIYSTNVVNGMAEYLRKITESSLILDTDSEIAEEYLKSGDKVFEF